jgi:hypothetical protein
MNGYIKVKVTYSISSILFIYALVSIATLTLWNSAGTNQVTGDEPHYLVMADGIGENGSLDQTLPYKEEFKKKNIYKPGLAAQDVEPSAENTHAIPGPHGFFSVHNIGLPLLLTLPFLFGGVVGAKLFMIFFGAAGVVLTWKITGLFSSEKKHRYWSTLAVCVSLPLIPASSQVYPDILAGLLSLTGLYWFITIQKKRSWLAELALASSIAFLPWLQIKLSATCALIFLAVVVRIFSESKDYKRIIKILLVVSISCVALAAYNYYAFGKITGPYQSNALEISKTSAMVLLGLGFDQNQGFLLQNPINFIGLVAIGGIYRYSKSLAIIWGLVFLSLIVPNALHPNWYGGGSFSGRFGWSATIVFILPAIYGLLQISKIKENVFNGIVILGILLQAYFFYCYAIDGVGLYNKAASTWPDSYSIYYQALHSWLPMLYNATWAYSYTPNYAWLVLVVSLIFSGFLSLNRLKSSIAYTISICMIIIFASGLYNNNPSSEATFYGKDLPSLTGRVSGLIRIAEPGVDNPGLVSFGPYFSLRKGKYSLVLKYSSSATGDQVIGGYEIFDASSANQISNYPLYGTLGSIKNFEVNFEVVNRGAHLFEFRNQWGGLYDIKIYEMVLREVDSASNILP